MPDLRDRLMGRLYKKNLTAAELARRVGVNPQNIQHWMRRGRVPGDKIFRVAEILDCSVEWLATGTGPQAVEESATVPRSRYCHVPYYLDDDRHLALSLDLLGESADHSEQLVMYEHRDLSMYPQIARGSHLVVDTTVDRPGENLVMLIAAGGALKVRRVFHRADGTIMLSADGDRARYPTEEVPAELIPDVKWVGQVIRSWSAIE